MTGPSDKTYCETVPMYNDQCKNCKRSAFKNERGERYWLTQPPRGVYDSCPLFLPIKTPQK